MRFISFLRTVILMTAIALAYIHLQMRIFDFAYEGKKKENDIRQLIEENGYLTYQILTLESANHLGGELLDENSGMQFGDPSDIVRMTVESHHENRERASPAVKVKENPLANLLSLKGPR